MLYDQMNINRRMAYEIMRSGLVGEDVTCLIKRDVVYEGL